MKQKSISQPKIKEKDLQRAILDWLRLKRIFAFKINNVGIKKPNGSYIPSQLRGISDIVGILPHTGRFLAIEVKGSGGVVSPHQEQFIANINKWGGVGIIAYKLEDIIEVLK